MHDANEPKTTSLNRRMFMTNGMIAAGAVTASAMCPASAKAAFAQSVDTDDNRHDLSKGDAAILRIFSCCRTD
jgi:hypothetical protein